MNHLNQFWKTYFSDIPPLAHTLKHQYKDRWVRFHALPESKRYPDTEQEYLEILFRHNAVLSTICQENGCVYVVLSEYSDTEKPEVTIAMPGFVKATFWRSVTMHEMDDVYKNIWHFYVYKVTWSMGVFDALFRLVADDKINEIMLINPKQQWVFHPYDGGVDVIVKNEQEKNLLKAKFSDWLSPRDDGF